jgi:molybdate transport system substrate-binding protein
VINVLEILSGGAAEGLIKALAPSFTSQTGWAIEGDYGAVGAMADKLRAGTRADVVVLTTAVLKGLASDHHLRPGVFQNIGLVQTAIAVRAGDSPPRIDTANTLRDALLAANAIFVPDTTSSTAGIHVAKVLAQLGIADDVAARLREFPNGATAMRHLAASKDKHPIGCTQTTEILMTPGLHLVGPLPPGCELATMYAAAITARAQDGPVAQKLIGLLAADEHRDLRVRMGFAGA